MFRSFGADDAAFAAGGGGSTVDGGGGGGGSAVGAIGAVDASGVFVT